MPVISINNVHYFYQRRGNGPPVVALHGFTGSSLSWADLTDALAPRTDIIAIDLLGHGHTSNPKSPDRYAMEHVAQDVMAVVDHLSLDCFSLLGYSMGGRLALYLTHRFPESIKALILESASPGIADAAERQLRRQQDHALAQSIEQIGISRFVDRWQQLPLFASQLMAPHQRIADLRQQRMQNSALGLANSLRGMGTGSQPSLWNALPDITVPTLLLCGELDEKYVRISGQIAAAAPNSELKVFGNAGHNIHFEQPPQYASIVSRFLERIS